MPGPAARASVSTSRSRSASRAARALPAARRRTWTWSSPNVSVCAASGSQSRPVAIGSSTCGHLSSGSPSWTTCSRPRRRAQQSVGWNTLCLGGGLPHAATASAAVPDDARAYTAPASPAKSGSATPPITAYASSSDWHDSSSSPIWARRDISRPRCSSSSAWRLSSSWACSSCSLRFARVVMSTTVAKTSGPRRDCTGARLISTGNSVPSRRRAVSSSPLPIGRGAGCRPIPGSMRGVSLGQARRHEALDRLATELLRRPAEHLLDPRAGVHDPTATVDGNDDVRARVEHRLGAEPERSDGPGSWRARGDHIAT